ncbi:MAG: hypothetical protein ACOYCE_12480, partial [Limnochordia bacterium]
IWPKLRSEVFLYIFVTKRNSPKPHLHRGSRLFLSSFAVKLGMESYHTFAGIARVEEGEVSVQS